MREFDFYYNTLRDIGMGEFDFYYNTLGDTGMGEMADYYLEKEMESMAFEKYFGTLTLDHMRELYKKNEWRTKENKTLKIEDMSNTHIENTIKFLKRTKRAPFIEIFNRYINKFKKELDSRKEVNRFHLLEI